MNVFKSEINVQSCKQGLCVADLLLSELLSNRCNHLVKQTWKNE